MLRQALSGAILLTGLLYLVALRQPGRPVRYLLKPVPMLLITALAAVGAHNARSWLVVAGLAISIVGDICLLWPDRWFRHGLGAFLVAHILYTGAFVLGAPGIGVWDVSTLLLLSAAAIAVFQRLRIGVMAAGGGSLLVAVGVYMAVITLMVWRATMTGNPFVAVGGLLFYLSDATLAWNRFARPIRGAEYAVMITYYAAQFCLALSLTLP